MADKCFLCLLRLIFLSSLLTGTREVEDAHVFISSGENVRLSCNNVLPDRKSTTWIYTRFRNSSAVELIALGVKKKNTERHKRLSLGSDCSLNINNITKEDCGHYICQQYKNGKELQGSVYLHVLHVSSSSSSSQTEISAGRSLTLSCQLYSYSFAGVSCDDWNRSAGIELFCVNQAGVKMTRSDHCIVTLNTTLLNEDHNMEWRCEVTHRNQVKASVTYTVKRSGTREVEDAHVFIRFGENVRLSCNNVLPDRKSTTWIYNRFRNSSTVELIALGVKKTDTESHERLSLGSDCSLNINNITKEDCGLYVCQQYKNGKLHGTDASVYLHVLRVSSSSSSSQAEISAGRSLTLSCQLYSYSFAGVSCDDWIRSAGIELFWVNQAGVKLNISDSRYQILFSSDNCISSLITTLLNEDHNRECRCAVTHIDQVKASVKCTVKNSVRAKTTTAVTPGHITKSTTTPATSTGGVGRATDDSVVQTVRQYCTQ